MGFCPASSARRGYTAGERLPGKGIFRSLLGSQWPQWPKVWKTTFLFELWLIITWGSVVALAAQRELEGEIKSPAALFGSGTDQQQRALLWVAWVSPHVEGHAPTTQSLLFPSPPDPDVTRGCLGSVSSHLGHLQPPLGRHPPWRTVSRRRDPQGTAGRGWEGGRALSQPFNGRPAPQRRGRGGPALRADWLLSPPSPQLAEAAGGAAAAWKFAAGRSRSHCHCPVPSRAVPDSAPPLPPLLRALPRAGSGPTSAVSPRAPVERWCGDGGARAAALRGLDGGG